MLFRCSIRWLVCSSAGVHGERVSRIIMTVVAAAVTLAAAVTVAAAVTLAADSITETVYCYCLLLLDG